MKHRSKGTDQGRENIKQDKVKERRKQMKRKEKEEANRKK
jgi:hypothetical protein